MGGVGPYAGLDLVGKILDQTEAKRDQEHLSVVLISFPQEIADRTSFLLGQTAANPAYALARIILRLEAVGASVAGIPCNTAHASQIFDVILDELGVANSGVRLVHMIEEVVDHVQESLPGIHRVGVLSTTGTYETKVYANALEERGVRPILPERSVQEAVHDAIFDPTYGIKAQSNPVTGAARSTILAAAHHLRAKGAEAFVLGCTVLPLAITEQRVEEMVVIDPTLVLARALIREASPAKLRPPVSD